MGQLGGDLAQGTTSRRVLIVDRGTESAQSLEAKLSQAGFEVATVVESEQVPDAMQRNSPHLVVLDWDLPGVMAIELIKRIRAVRAGVRARLIILSMLSGDDPIVTGFELGADDYVVKPFSVPELVARVRAVLRTSDSQHGASALVRFRELELWVDECRVRVRETTLPLRSMEYRLLEFLIRHPGRAFSRSSLLERVWGENCRVQERAVDVVVQRIRSALAPYGCEDYLQTIRGVGYRLSVAPAPSQAV